MTFTSIMVHVDIGQPDDAPLGVAVDLAQQFDAKLIGIAAAHPPLSLYGEELNPALIDQLNAEFTARLTLAEDRFRNAATGLARPVEWRSATEPSVSYVSRQARAADLIVTGSNRNSVLLDPSHGHLDPGDLVMRAGRPVLVVPPQVDTIRLKCAMIAWKDTREARRAVCDALPLLNKVQDVVVVEIIEDESYRSLAHGRVNDVVAWLKGHGIAAETRVLHFPDDKEPLEKLWQYGADVVVAGAYGHAQLREWVFGGFTRDLLKRSPQCVFLAH